MSINSMCLLVKITNNSLVNLETSISVTYYVITYPIRALLYTFQRPHQALDGRTPVEEVLN